MQEQPHLLDAHLEEFLSILVSIVRAAGVDDGETLHPNSNATKRDVAAQAFKFLYLIVKVRGYKIVVNKLPHEVSTFRSNDWLLVVWTALLMFTSLGSFECAVVL